MKFTQLGAQLKQSLIYCNNHLIRANGLRYPSGPLLTSHPLHRFNSNDMGLFKFWKNLKSGHFGLRQLFWPSEMWTKSLTFVIFPFLFRPLVQNSVGHPNSEQPYEWQTSPVFRFNCILSYIWKLFCLLRIWLF